MLIRPTFTRVYSLAAHLHSTCLHSSSRCSSPSRLIRAMSSNSSSPPLQLVPGQTRIGWIGTGVMGSSMCGHIIRSCSPSYPTVVYNRTASKTKALAELGAKVVDSPEAVADQCDVLFTIVGYPQDVRAVYLGDGSTEHPGVLSRLKRGAVLIDMTTSEPTLAVEIAKAAAAKGIGALDAPVSGGDVGAKNATLSIMAGGEEETYQSVLPLFQAMGKNLTLCGGPGAGQHTKAVNQTLIASNMVGVCEGLLYAHKAGLDPMRTIQAVSAGAAGSWSISNLGPRIFFVEHFVKDLSIILSESRRMNLSLPGLSLAYSLYVALMAQGGAKNGTQALYTALEKLNGMEPRNNAS